MKTALEMLDCVSSERIASAENAGRRIKVLRYALPTAAAVMLVLGVILLIGRGSVPQDDKNALLPDAAENSTVPTASPTEATTSVPSPAVTEDARTAFVAPPYVSESGEFGEADIAQILKYDGRVYRKSGELPHFSDLMGEKVGTAKSSYITYITKKPEGSVFAVKGYDPEFILCRRGFNGVIELFVNDNDVTFYSAADLFEDRLHISERLSSIGYLNYEVTDEHHLPILFELDGDEYSDAIEKFIEAIDEGEWIERTYYYSQTADSVHIVITLNDGMTVKISVCDDGEAVTLVGYYEDLFPGCAIKVDKEKLRPIVEAVKNRVGKSVGSLWTPEYFTEEECRADERFGAFVPTVIPEGYYVWRYHIFYDFDDDTGEITETKMIEINYNRSDSSSHMAFEVVPKELLDEWNYHTPAELNIFKRSDITSSHTGHDDYEFYATAYSGNIGIWMHSVHYEENVNINEILDTIYEVIDSIKK